MSSYSQIRRRMVEEARQHSARQGLERLKQLRDEIAKKNREAERGRLERPPTTGGASGRGSLPIT